jgi:hypothetical protein
MHAGDWHQGPLARAFRALLWLVATMLATAGAWLVVLGATNSGDMAPEFFIVPGVVAALTAATLAFAAWNLRK